jgi:hypothetical protein
LTSQASAQPPQGDGASLTVDRRHVTASLVDILREQVTALTEQVAEYRAALDTATSEITHLRARVNELTPKTSPWDTPTPVEEHAMPAPPHLLPVLEVLGDGATVDLATRVQDYVDRVAQATSVETNTAARNTIQALVEAIRVTQEYIQLPPIEGWAWYDTLRAVAPQVADQLKRDYKAPDDGVNPFLYAIATDPDYQDQGNGGVPVDPAVDALAEWLDNQYETASDDSDTVSARALRALEEQSADLGKLHRVVAEANRRLDATQPAADVPNQVIRDWADSAGVDCPARGPIPARVRAAYSDANPEPVTASE